MYFCFCNIRAETYLLGLAQSVKDMPVFQDGPPPGGFPSVRYARRIPSTGPSGAALFAVGGVIMAYGFYKVNSFLVLLMLYANIWQPIVLSLVLLLV